jgi:hypothetical protein
MRALPLLPLLTLLGCGPGGASGPPAAPPTRTSTPGIAEAIARLGDDDCAVRRKAADDLLAAGRESLPLLESARQSADPEVRMRALELTAAIESEPLVWVGTRDDRWENAENWTPRQVPGSWSVAIVPEAIEPLFSPTIRGAVEVRDLVLLRKSELTVEEQATLRVNGRLRSRGVLRALGVVQSAE